MRKEKVLLLGASGSMGFAAFQELWSRKNDNGERKYDIVLLLRPSKKNKKIFRKYLKSSGIISCKDRRIREDLRNSFKIVWGDATIYDDVVQAIRGVDWVLCTMAIIPPEADRHPAQAKAVNTTAIENIVRAIEAEPNGAENIRLVYTGTVAATGDRLPPIQRGRVGDPLKPSIFDFYATTKVRGEWAVLESNIKRWVSLRQTFIMIPDILRTEDPIMFHQPINSYMENNTMRDAGRGLVNCLDVPDDSDFWRRVYNMAGGPSCRVVFLDFMKIAYELLGMDYKNIMERKWFALRNFHMQFFDDSALLNEYIHNWGDSMDDYWDMVKSALPRSLKVVATLNKISPTFQKFAEKTARKRLDALARHPDGTLGWYEAHNEMRMSAFYGSYERFESIPDWDEDMPEMRHDAPFEQLNHGYDETKTELELNDLQDAAAFRGGECMSLSWSGDLYETLGWRCAFDHAFAAKPYTIIKAGHWCPQCLPPPWNYDEIATKNPFFAQVWYPNHDPSESYYYPEDCYKDVVS
ncbi:NAD-dependent epimerase/dehydratase family protein [Mycobacterium riyadhense]|uniref:NAD-dependent epimerase/dehydratase family protein n=1 Tax=Mycobacterium riyadhense TaxID=486698 RepID=UPI00195C2CAF|nr:NAD(P)-dependent oxidoreductase [Mycobacterium riyadhense]